MTTGARSCSAPGASSGGGTTEHVENFVADSNGYGSDILEHDAAGNLTYDGNYLFGLQQRAGLYRIPVVTSS